MGNEQTKTVLEDSGEPITYFAINIKQPDKLHIVPSDSGLSKMVTRVLEPHCRWVMMYTLLVISDITHYLPVQHRGARAGLYQAPLQLSMKREVAQRFHQSSSLRGFELSTTRLFRG